MPISLPSHPKIIKLTPTEGVFEIEGCYPGYGLTLGNALRRVLLSSLPGAAITSVKIKGVQHEFSTIPYVLEDVIQIILNLKQIRFRIHTDQPVTAILKAKGEKKVKAGDIETPAELEVVNPDAPIATLTDRKAELEMELEIEPGLGYVPVEQRKKEKLEIGKIAIDAIFSPIKKVNYTVENMRVGDRNDYNRLRMTIETDGTITPEEALKKAAEILMNQFKVFTVLEEAGKKEKKEKLITKKTKSVKKETKKAAVKEEKDPTKLKIEELKLPARLINLLTSNGIKTVAGLIRKTESDLEKIEGLGGKGIKEIRKVLGQFGLTLKE